MDGVQEVQKGQNLDDLVLWHHPLRTLHYCVLEVTENVIEGFSYVVSQRASRISAVLVVILAIVLPWQEVTSTNVRGCDDFLLSPTPNPTYRHGRGSHARHILCITG